MSIRIAILAAALAGTAAAHAGPGPVPGKEEVKAQKVRIEEQYDQAQSRCKRVQGHARELCKEQARADRDIQAAELRLQAEPTPENDHKLRLAKAEAAYALALVRCKDMDGSARGVCRGDARQVYEMARREARLQQEVVTQSLRSDNSVRERTAESDRLAQAEYNKARERCEALPPEGRLPCLNDAKTRFGKL